MVPVRVAPTSLLPLLLLQPRQAIVRFHASPVPPRVTGWMWSMAAPSRPQYWQVLWSRSRMRSRISGGMCPSAPVPRRVR